MNPTSALSRLKIGVLGNGWHTQSLRWVWFFLRISHALRKASERATQESNLDKALVWNQRVIGRQPTQSLADELLTD